MVLLERGRRGGAVGALPMRGMSEFIPVLNNVLDFDSMTVTYSADHRGGIG
jgi:hypothetical protein